MNNQSLSDKDLSELELQYANLVWPPEYTQAVRFVNGVAVPVGEPYVGWNYDRHLNARRWERDNAAAFELQVKHKISVEIAINMAVATHPVNPSAAPAVVVTIDDGGSNLHEAELMAARIAVLKMACALQTLTNAAKGK